MGEIEKIIKDYHRIVTDPAKTTAEKALASIQKSVELAQAIHNSFGCVTRIDLQIIYAAARLIAESSMYVADEDEKRMFELFAELAIESTDIVSAELMGGGEG